MNPFRLQFKWVGTRVFKGAKLMSEIVPDQTYPGMWRVVLPDGTLSDMYNITWAKEHAVMEATRAYRKAHPNRNTDSSGH
jgi:hypothetical protein